MVSIFPCDLHGRRSATRLGAAYLTVSRRTDKRSRKLRLCAQCLGDLLTQHAGLWTEVGLDDEAPLEEMCAACDKAATETDGLHCFFGTVFEPGRERRDFFAWYCDDDAQALIDLYKLD